MSTTPARRAYRSATAPHTPPDTAARLDWQARYEEELEYRDLLIQMRDIRIARLTRQVAALEAANALLAALGRTHGRLAAWWCGIGVDRRQDVALAVLIFGAALLVGLLVGRP